MWTVVLFGFLCDMPTSILYMALTAEAVCPTMGDDDEIIVADAPNVVGMHPGYAGPGLLDAREPIPPDGLQSATLGHLQVEIEQSAEAHD